MVPEAPRRRTGAGLVPDGEGWLVLNAREMALNEGHFGAHTRFEGESRIPQVGVNIGMLAHGIWRASTTGRAA
jgi:hypothetical protein